MLYYANKKEIVKKDNNVLQKDVIFFVRTAFT